MRVSVAGGVEVVSKRVDCLLLLRGSSLDDLWTIAYLGSLLWATAPPGCQQLWLLPPLRLSKVAAESCRGPGVLHSAEV
jgi:hypothetical protein